MRNGLPFSKPRVRLYGDQTQAQKHLGDANLLMYQVRMFCDSAKVPVYSLRRELPDGTVIEAAQFGAQEIVTVWGKELAQATFTAPPMGQFARLVWMAEGFVITPRTSAAPDGYGLPDTEDNVGTIGGPLREVIINRFEHNNYPDSFPGVESLASAPLFYVEGEDKLTSSFPIALGSTPQFSQWLDPQLQEVQGSEWHCHRPQSVRFIGSTEAPVPDRFNIRSDYMKGLFDGTNALRDQAGVPALYPAIRGWYNGLADAIANEMRLSGNQAHDSVLYRTGYQSFTERYTRYGEPLYMVGENLATSPSGNAALVMQAWKDSPEHYDNITFDWADDGEGTGAGILQLAAVDGRLEKYDGAPISTFDGVMTAQGFYGTNTWVHTLHSTWTGDLGSVSWQMADDPRYEVGRYNVVSYGDGVATPLGVAAVVIRGRFINLPVTGHHCIHGAALAALGGAVYLRVAIGYVSGARKIEVREWRLDRVGEGLETNVWARTLADEVKAVSRVNFSEGGGKAVYTEYIEEALPESYILSTTADLGSPTTSLTTAPPVSYSLQHVIFDGADFYAQAKQELFVEVLECEGGSSGSVRYHTLCEGSYTAFQDWDGDSLISATCSVRWEVRWFHSADTWALTDFIISCKGTIQFPGSGSFEYCNAQCVQPEGDVNGYVSGVSGFITNVAYLDIRKPDNTVYVKHELGGEEGYIQNRATGSMLPYSTWRLSMDVMFRGEVVKHKDNVAPQMQIDGWWNPDSAWDYPPILYAPDMRTWAPVGMFVPNPLPWSKTASYSSGVWSFGYIGFSAGGQVGSGSPKLTGIAQRHHASLLPQPYNGVFYARVQPAPVFGQQRLPMLSRELTGYNGDPVEIAWRDDMTVRLADYGDEYILAGEVGQVGGFEKYAFGGEDKFFWRSSVDLEAVTGLTLKDNIMPVGVL